MLDQTLTAEHPDFGYESSPSDTIVSWPSGALESIDAVLRAGARGYVPPSQPSSLPKKKNTAPGIETQPEPPERDWDSLFFQEQFDSIPLHHLNSLNLDSLDDDGLNALYLNPCDCETNEYANICTAHPESERWRCLANMQPPKHRSTSARTLPPLEYERQPRITKPDQKPPIHWRLTEPQPEKPVRDRDSLFFEEQFDSIPLHHLNSLDLHLLTDDNLDADSRAVPKLRSHHKPRGCKTGDFENICEVHPESEIWKCLASMQPLPHRSTLARRLPPLTDQEREPRIRDSLYGPDENNNPNRFLNRK